LSRCVTICPLGFVEDEIIDRIAEHIEERCGIECRISKKMGKPEYAYDERRCQYNSKLILKRLIKRSPKKIFGFMGVTSVDLFVPILTYVYGLAAMEDQCSIISTHRLQPQFYDQPPDRDLLVDRAQKTALHEMGHCLGLTHCRNRHCVMYSSAKIEDTDFKKSVFCPTCSDLFKWYLDKCLRSDRP
jgi:archaemetzincin